MIILHVDIAAHPDRVADFLAATLRNAEASVAEPGILRFDVLTDEADRAHVVLIEVYRDADAVAAHKRTPHYLSWRETVADMMAKPRTPTTFSAVFPAGEDGWSSR